MVPDNIQSGLPLQIAIGVPWSILLLNQMNQSGRTGRIFLKQGHYLRPPPRTKQPGPHWSGLLPLKPE